MVRVRSSASRRRSLARPKSAIFTRPFLSRSRFSGLMSRCTSPSSCAYWSASQMFGTTASAPAEHLENFKLGQLLRHLCGIGDVDEIGRQTGSTRAGRRAGGGFHQALRAETVGSIRGERLPALGAHSGGIHVGSPTTEAHRE